MAFVPKIVTYLDPCLMCRSVARLLDMSPRSTPAAEDAVPKDQRIMTDALEEDLSVLMDSLVVNLVARCRSSNSGILFGLAVSLSKLTDSCDLKDGKKPVA